MRSLPTFASVAARVALEVARNANLGLQRDGQQGPSGHGLGTPNI